MNKTLEKWLIKIGIPLGIAVGVISFVMLKGEKTITYDEYLATVQVYNEKIWEIKDDCDNDVRCLRVNGKPNVRFWGIENKRDIVKQLNQWIRDEAENPNVYKKIRD